MEIEEKYIKLLGKLVYNKQLDKYGRISSLELMSSIRLYLMFNVYYDEFDSHYMLTIEEIDRGDIQFVILTEECTEEYCKLVVDDIKSVLGDKFREDMILCMTEEKWQAWIRERKTINAQKLHTDLVFFDKISTEVMMDDFYSRELYLKYKDGVLSKEELLYALVNHLCQEYKRIWDQNGRYFFKYEFEKTLEETMAEMKARQNRN